MPGRHVRAGAAVPAPAAAEFQPVYPLGTSGLVHPGPGTVPGAAIAAGRTEPGPAFRSDQIEATMKQDRFLTGILIFIGILVLAAVGLFFLRNKAPAYGPED